MRVYSATGLVLHRTLLGETDKILTLYTREHGKLSAVAKGARKAGSRISGATELFTNGRFLIAKVRSLDVISQCEIIESYPALRIDLDRLARAMYICELVDRMTLEHDESACEVLHDLTVGALHLLQRTETYIDGAVHAYELYLLAELGYAPVLDRCAKCGKVLQSVTAAFSSSHGGVLCPDDRHIARDAAPISWDALQTLIVLRDGDSEAIVRMHVTQRVGAEIARTLRSYLAHRLDRSLKSAEFLEQLRHNGRETR
jgi:DNA repair protein RecO (recombination protein O)